ncbi:hypothetical protein, partial [Limnobacter sp.]|uniref:hypothetical protein n=1 Tax=Limnobacter sp. TaxID=2003368 RepID=UPI002FE12605
PNLLIERGQTVQINRATSRETKHANRGIPYFKKAADLGHSQGVELKHPFETQPLCLKNQAFLT